MVYLNTYKIGKNITNYHWRNAYKCFHHKPLPKPHTSVKPSLLHNVLELVMWLYVVVMYSLPKTAQGPDLINM